MLKNKRHLNGGVCFRFRKNQCCGLSVLPLGTVMNDPTGTTACFGFLGFFASLFPRTWPFAMMILLAMTTEVPDCRMHCARQSKLV
jgi:hypothetical protein